MNQGGDPTGDGHSSEVRIVIGVSGQIQGFDLKIQTFLDEAYKSD
jgi:hypothetical protein